MTYMACISSPIGVLQLEASEIGLKSVKIVDDNSPITIQIPYQLLNASNQLREYFAGTRTVFELKYDFEGATDFYKQVWQVVDSIPYGKTRAYSDIANQLNNPGAVRAVGMANGKNPIPIIIPCHRVVGKNGKLTGYFYGLEVKRKLLAIENPQKYSMVQGSLF